MSNQHVLKIHPAPLADLMSGAKTAEVRRNDRGFQVGDTVRLMEVNPETLNWTGRPDLVRTISHIQTGYGLPDGMCVLSYVQAEQQEAQGAQAGDLASTVRVLLEVPQLQGEQAFSAQPIIDRVRAALTTQPAAGAPAAWQWRSRIKGGAWDAWENGRYDFEPATFMDVEHRALYAAPPAAAHGDDFQERVQPWMLECFGEMIAGDREERNHRFLEEALELVQSNGCTASEAHQLVDYVFGRPVGEAAQEVGGVMVTLAALCLANSLDMHDAAEVELARIWTKVEAIRAKQAAKPKHSPLPVAAAHGDELVAVVGTVPDGSGFKSLDFKVDLQDLADGTRLYAMRAQGDGEVQ